MAVVPTRALPHSPAPDDPPAMDVPEFVAGDRDETANDVDAAGNTVGKGPADEPPGMVQPVEQPAHSRAPTQPIATRDHAQVERTAMWRRLMRSLSGTSSIARYGRSVIPTPPNEYCATAESMSSPPSHVSTPVRSARIRDGDSPNFVTPEIAKGPDESWRSVVVCDR